MEQNYPEALKYLNLAAKAENPRALHLLGIFSKDGLGGVPRDADKMLQYFMKAEKLNNPDAI